MKKFYLIAGAVLAVALVPALAQANARLTSVVPVGSGCVSGPTGQYVQAWDVEPGETYTIRLEDVTECAEGGTAATLNVRVNSSNVGNVDLVATLVEPGVYEFDYTMPADGICTFPVFYCTVPGDNSSGIFAIRDDGAPFQAHLRASMFEEGCTNPTELIGGDCDVVGVEKTSWGTMKSTYH